jgi:protein-S-isoprenylcysteine O-methyltransferase Ste14
VVLQPRQQLVTSGPYAAVRHPLYASVVLVSLFAFLAPGWLAVGGAFAAVCLYFVAVRVPAEEALMAKAFPEEWRTYARRTGVLTPSLSWITGANGRNDCAASRAESTPLMPHSSEGDKAT